MKGYIILNSNGDRLTLGRWWGAGDGRVWSESEKDEILSNCSGWDEKPAFVQAATFDPNSKRVIVSGNLMPVSC